MMEDGVRLTTLLPSVGQLSRKWASTAYYRDRFPYFHSHIVLPPHSDFVRLSCQVPAGSSCLNPTLLAALCSPVYLYRPFVPHFSEPSASVAPKLKDGQFTGVKAQALVGGKIVLTCMVQGFPIPMFR
jgi:hypothetical protein